MTAIAPTAASHGRNGREDPIRVLAQPSLGSDLLGVSRQLDHRRRVLSCRCCPPMINRFGVAGSDWTNEAAHELGLALGL